MIDQGCIAVDGKRYRYIISKMNVVFKVLPVINHLDLWNESGELKETIIFQGDSVEERIRMLREWGWD